MICFLSKITDGFKKTKKSVNIQQSPEIIDLLLKTHEQIVKNQEQTSKLIEVQQSQTSQLLESHFKLLDLINKKN